MVNNVTHLRPKKHLLSFHGDTKCVWWGKRSWLLTLSKTLSNLLPNCHGDTGNVNLNILIWFPPHSLCASNPCPHVLTPISHLTPTPVSLGHISPLAILTRMANRPIFQDSAKLRGVVKEMKRDLMKNKKNSTGLSSSRGSGEAAGRTLVHGYITNYISCELLLQAWSGIFLYCCTGRRCNTQEHS